MGNRYKLYEAFGEKKTAVEWAAEYGIKPKTFNARVSRYGMSVEEALTKPLQKGRLVEAFGRAQYVKAWAREFDISRETLRHRLNSGMCPEEALTTPIGEVYSVRSYGAPRNEDPVLCECGHPAEHRVKIIVRENTTEYLDLCDGCHQDFLEIESEDIHDRTPPIKTRKRF